MCGRVRLVKLSMFLDKSHVPRYHDRYSSSKPFGAAAMTYSIYGTPYKPTERVFYGTVETIDHAVVELKRLRRAGVAEVYAIGFAPELAQLPLAPTADAAREQA